MDRDFTGRLRSMVGALFSRHSSPSSRGGGGGGGIRPEAVDVIRAPPSVRRKEVATNCVGSVWVRDEIGQNHSSQQQQQQQNHGFQSSEKIASFKDKRNVHDADERSAAHSSELKLQSNHTTADVVTPFPSGDTRGASLTRKLKTTGQPRVLADVRDKYSTLPAFNGSKASRAHPMHQYNPMFLSRSTHTDSPSTPEPRTPQTARSPKEEEVRRLARTMADSIENLISNLHGIVGDLRQLVLQIDAVTDSIDVNCDPDTLSQQGYNKAASRCNEKVAAFTQTDFQQSYDSWDRNDTVRNQECFVTRSYQRYSYPQQFYSLDSNISQQVAINLDRRIQRRPKPAKRPVRERDRVDHIIVKTSFPEKSMTVDNRIGRNIKPQLMQSNSIPIRRRPQVPSFLNNRFHDEEVFHVAVPFVSPENSVSFVPAESPPNPAPTLFGAYRQEKSDRAKDTDSLPNPELKNWREMMERQCGSADSLTPQMDWSYLALSDHHNPCLTAEGLRLSRNVHQLEASSRHTAGGRMSAAGHNPAFHRSRLDRSKLSPPGPRMKYKNRGIPRIPEQGELCDSGYGRDDFPQSEMPFNGQNNAEERPSTAEQHAHQNVNGPCEVFQCDSGPLTAHCGSREGQRAVGVLPHVQQSIGGASLGWNTRSKALPDWPSEELSSIGASDSEVDDLNSPYLHQHFHYPRRSSAKESISPDNDVRQVHLRMSRAVSVSETIASGGFEVRNDMETSPESEANSTYKGQYESAMENRLEQLSNEVEGSDFSDADADVGSDVLEQSLTSLEETSSVKYDRELNTWTSYALTHIDSDDVVSECTSDILNENFCDAAATNPGFDDVSINFDDVGFPAFALPQCKFDSLNTQLE